MNERLQTAGAGRGRVAAASVVVIALCSAGCSTWKAAQVTAQAALPVAEKALEIVGLKKPAPPELPESAKPPRQVVFRLHASSSLNLDAASGQPLALVTRIYKLRSPNAFLGAPYEVFGQPAVEKDRLGADLIEVREVQLVPGQRIEGLEKVAREAGYVGIVALFHDPSPQRWRYAFSTEALEQSGLSVGAHACALTVSQGEPLGLPGSFARTSPGRCPSSN